MASWRAAPRTGESLPPGENRSLDADRLVAGRVRAAGGRLRIDLSLFGPQAARVLAEQYRRPAPTEDPYGNLSPREREVFHLVVGGHTTKEIARDLVISIKTADNHRCRLMEKLDVHNTAELVRYAARRGLLP